MFVIPLPATLASLGYLQGSQHICPADRLDPRSRPFSIELYSSWGVQQHKSTKPDSGCVFVDARGDEFSARCFYPVSRRDLQSFLESWDKLKSAAMAAHGYWPLETRGLSGGLVLLPIQSARHTRKYLGSGLLIEGTKVITVKVKFDHAPSVDERNVLKQTVDSIELR
jgi:hypothetical protein